LNENKFYIGGFVRISTSQQKSVFVACLLTVFVLGVGCETPDDNTIETIRNCVDTASRVAATNPSAAAVQAKTCDTMAQASSIATPTMAQIKFGIILLIEQKLTQIAQMANSLKSNTQAPTSGLSTALSIMVFNNSPSPAAIPSTDDVNYSTRIQASGNTLGGNAALLGNMISVATSLASVVGTVTDGPSAVAAIQACATSQASCPPAEQQSLANSIYNMEQGACASASDQASTDKSNPCFQMKAALNGATPSNPVQLLQNFYNYTNAPH
jgi:hypothetical protein